MFYELPLLLLLFVQVLSQTRTRTLKHNHLLARAAAAKCKSPSSLLQKQNLQLMQFFNDAEEQRGKTENNSTIIRHSFFSSNFQSCFQVQKKLQTERVSERQGHTVEHIHQEVTRLEKKVRWHGPCAKSLQVIQVCTEEQLLLMLDSGYFTLFSYNTLCVLELFCDIQKSMKWNWMKSEKSN